MGNLASTDKVVTAEMLQAYHDDHVAPFLGGNVLGAQSRFKQSDIYSTSERIVGCWTDGRPLYQKTIHKDSVAFSSGATSIQLCTTASLNLRELISVEGFMIDSGNDEGLIPCVYRSDNMGQVYVDWANNVVVYYKQSGASNAATNFNITLKYTKTTDAAGSYYLAGENDYSTDEKIIGTWIDGKPIYRKTVTGTTPSSSGLVTVLPTTTAQILKFSGFLKDSSGWGVFAGSDLNVNAGDQNFGLGYDKDTRYKMWFQLGSACLSRPYTLTLEYTKS